jgi:hypothetical protein
VRERERGGRGGGEEEEEEEEELVRLMFIIPMVDFAPSVLLATVH